MPSARTTHTAPVKAETAKISRFIKDTISQIEDMEKKKKQLKLLVSPRKVTAKLGVFSKQVYQPGQGRPPADDMSHLPNEIVHSILGFLKNADQVALALTCKHYMAMVESARPVPTKRPTVTKPMRLAVLLRLLDWMPPGLKLCYSCVKFVPSAENGPWHGDVKLAEKKLANTKAVGNGPHCNSCYRRGQIEVVKASANAQRLKRKVREM